MSNTSEGDSRMPIRCPICGKLFGYLGDNNGGDLYLYCIECRKEISIYFTGDALFCQVREGKKGGGGK